MWGELAAWRISAELADELDSYEAKMAATSQAHDEARHFYTMYDYLVALDAVPDRLDPFAQKLLEEVMNADHLAKKLMGMRWWNPLRSLCFTLLKNWRSSLCSRFLPYFEKDEARHVALGVQYLPALLKNATPLERLDLWFFQLRLVSYEVMSMRGLAGDMLKLGVPPRDLVKVGMGKQLAALELLFEEQEVTKDIPIAILNRYALALTELTLPHLDEDPSLELRVKRAINSLLGREKTESVDLVPEVAEKDIPLMRKAG